MRFAKRIFFVIMKPMKKSYLFILLLFFMCGCACVQEPFKVVWGSSTKALYDNRDTATVKMYECFANDCFDKIVDIIKNHEAKITKKTQIGDEEVEVEEVSQYNLFIKDRKNYVIVVMNVPGSIDTTEVGIFITPLKLKESKVEIISLSTAAQKTVANMIFEQLDKIYPEIKEIPLP